MIAWVYGSGFPKSLDVSKAIDKAAGAVRARELRFTGTIKGGALHAGKNNGNARSWNEVQSDVPATEAARQWQGWGTALKPALEPITVARKPLIGTVAANVLAHGTGALNVDGCRVEALSGLTSGGRKTSSPLHMDRDAGVNRIADRTEEHPSGRWPANLIHDGSDEIDFVFSGGASDSSTLPDLNRQVSVGGRSSSPARFFYCAKASKKDRDEGCEGMEERVICITEGHGRGDINTSKGDGTGVRENRPRRNHHPTVKPTALMRYLCRLVTPRGGTVLDPFMGSGSTGKAAVLEGFNFIGIEREAE
jgi:site-specific DNA-methyltransferase (adenine-specific)